MQINQAMVDIPNENFGVTIDMDMVYRMIDKIPLFTRIQAYYV